MSDELDILKSVAARLEAAGIPYMVTGSMAANFYATPRMTRDINLVVELREGDVNARRDPYFGSLSENHGNTEPSRGNRVTQVHEGEPVRD